MTQDIVLFWLEDLHLLFIIFIETEYRAKQSSPLVLRSTAAVIMAHLILVVIVSIHGNGLSFIQTRIRIDVKFGRDLNVIRSRARKGCNFTKGQFNLRGGKKLLNLIMVDPLAVTLIRVGAVDAAVITLRL
ncbi:hypothetical protein E4U60_007891 [Claviceps pazoutovae]|uniref:Uncharacterized protein n=1 Tax=Claviceps pazoutovae TaxID=1649127 RepID=A0A9P7SHS6_9HYPO|nr:hypothetical protein E4U60_007891 [Claviceps pazoutovae]